MSDVLPGLFCLDTVPLGGLAMFDGVGRVALGDVLVGLLGQLVPAHHAQMRGPDVGEAGRRDDAIRRNVRIQSGPSTHAHHRALSKSISKRDRLDDMARIVLRVRLVGGDLMDVTFEDPDADEPTMIDWAVTTLSADGGALRCRHGDRMVILYGRGVAAMEIAPRGAVV